MLQPPGRPAPSATGPELGGGARPEPPAADPDVAHGPLCAGREGDPERDRPPAEEAVIQPVRATFPRRTMSVATRPWPSSTAARGSAGGRESNGVVAGLLSVAQKT